MIALATAINYLDRQNLPVAIVEMEIKKSFPISDSQYGLINSVFVLAQGTTCKNGYRVEKLETSLFLICINSQICVSLLHLP